jgi:hypothetical protein
MAQEKLRPLHRVRDAEVLFVSIKLHQPSSFRAKSQERVGPVYDAAGVVRNRTW